jgi:hypothetical protein
MLDSLVNIFVLFEMPEYHFCVWKRCCS